jgi:hypothetical protein
MSLESEAIQKQIKKLAAGTFGQVPEVRSFMGRQLMFLNNSSQLFILPAAPAITVQVNDPASPINGMDLFVVDLDQIDGGNPIL